MEDKAETVFSAMLQAHPDLKLVYTSNDLAAAAPTSRLRTRTSSVR